MEIEFREDYHLPLRTAIKYMTKIDILMVIMKNENINRNRLPMKSTVIIVTKELTTDMMPIQTEARFGEIEECASPKILSV